MASLLFGHGARLNDSTTRLVSRVDADPSTVSRTLVIRFGAILPAKRLYTRIGSLRDWLRWNFTSSWASFPKASRSRTPVDAADTTGWQPERDTVVAISDGLVSLLHDLPDPAALRTNPPDQIERHHRQIQASRNRLACILASHADTLVKGGNYFSTMYDRTQKLLELAKRKDLFTSNGKLRQSPCQTLQSLLPDATRMEHLTQLFPNTKPRGAWYNEKVGFATSSDPKTS
jgi:hypothetical protein